MGKQREVSGVPSVIEQQPVGVAAYDYGADAGAGYENTGASDYTIPYLGVLQKGSPQVLEEKAQYIEGAKAGMLVNSVTQQLFDGKGEGVLLVPVHREHVVIKFIPRSAGGGFVGVLEPTDQEWLDAVERFRKVPRGSDQKVPLTADGKVELRETFNLYSLVTDASLLDWEPVVLGLSGSKRKPYRNWMTKSRGIVIKQGDRRITPPLFAHVWRLNTVFQEGNGNDWYNIAPSLFGGSAEAARLAPDHALFQAAKKFRDLVTSGQVKAQQPQDDNEAEVVDDLGNETI